MNERLTAIRKKMDLTMEEFGRRLNISKATVSNIENGRRTVTDRIIADICREFNVSEKWLRTGEGEMFREISMEDELMEWAGRVLSSHPESFRYKFVKMLMALDDDGWELLEKMALQLLAQHEDRAAQEDPTKKDQDSSPGLDAGGH